MKSLYKKIKLMMSFDENVIYHDLVNLYVLMFSTVMEMRWFIKQKRKNVSISAKQNMNDVKSQVSTSNK